MKYISILGSTGSIGVNTLEVIRNFPDRFKVIGLAAGTNLTLLRKQIKFFDPQIVSVLTEDLAKQLKRSLHKCCKPEIVYGNRGIVEVASLREAEMVVSAIVGAAGLIPTFSAIRSGKNVALANKETLVMAGEIVMQEARSQGVKIIPIDSEHSGIFQSLQGRGKKYVNTIILTASGGPFLNYSVRKLTVVTPKDALRHPNWKMGKKVTIDSASLMNKGLEVIEAHWLFDIPQDKIKVYIHPQSVVHAMVEYIDKSVIAQLSLPDMRGPIAYALSYPERMSTGLSSLNLLDIKRLVFIPPNLKKFPALGLAYSALECGGTMPTVLNAANEAAVSAFLKKKITFTDISKIIERTMSVHSPRIIACLEDVMEADKWARQEAGKLIAQH